LDEEGVEMQRSRPAHGGNDSGNATKQEQYAASQWQNKLPEKMSYSDYVVAARSEDLSDDSDH
jgi:hypothetical protein